MNITKLPLSERIERLNTGLPAHMEYYPSIINDIAHTPIAAYMESFDVDWGPLQERLGHEVSDPDELTYMQVADYVAAWYKLEYTRPAALMAMRLLAAPLIEAGKQFQRPKREEVTANG